MAKRLSKNEKDEIMKAFTEGLTLEQLSNQFNFTKLTISRNLKKKLGDIKYKELLNINKNKGQSDNQKYDFNEINKNKSKEKNHFENLNIENYGDKNTKNEAQSQEGEFLEIPPLNFDIDNAKRKDLSSFPLRNVELPDVVYMIVDKSIELEIKLLNEYPEWHFLSKEDLNRKTIQIFYDLKVAKRNCNKNQKVLKVPNSKVFQIVSPILISRGISRIITEEFLISL